MEQALQHSSTSRWKTGMVKGSSGAAGAVATVTQQRRQLEQVLHMLLTCSSLSRCYCSSKGKSRSRCCSWKIM